MTPEQIELVQSSWKKVLPITDVAADLFYDKLFELAPQVRELFADDMDKQKKALMAMLGRVVASLNDLDALVPAVQELGERHVGYGAETPHYEVVGEALLWTLEQGLGEEWNDDLKEAWAAAYGILSVTMIEAADARIEADKKAEQEAAAEAQAKAEKEEAGAKAQAEKEKAEARKKKRANRVVGGTVSADKAKQAEQASGPHRQLVVFDLDGEHYGLEISSVREIIRQQEITRVPNTPDYIEGVINLRGKVIPVVDLRIRFGMKTVERDDDSRVVVVDMGGNEIGMIVDAVTEVSRIPESGIEPPSSVITSEDSGYLAGIGKSGEQMIILLNIGKLISAEHLEPAAAASAAPDQLSSAA